MVQQKGYSLIPISLYFKRNFVKVELGIGRGKKLYDKRQDMAKKESERRIERAMKQNFWQFLYKYGIIYAKKEFLTWMTSKAHP